MVNPILVYMTYTSNNNQKGNVIFSDANSGEVIFEDSTVIID